ncbi:hypothetical protein DL769_005722 [Monosporascus sp. CRB-8-3]|nr:hypothetical protein DL769_005722 [Monosporascus sp. CRB-8-3]
MEDHEFPTTPTLQNSFVSMVFKRWTKRFRESPVTSKKISVNDSSNGLTVKTSGEPDSPVNDSGCLTNDLTTPISNVNSPTESDLRSPITESHTPKRDDTLVYMAFFRRKPGVTVREFYDHWEHVHGPLVRPWMEKYGFVGYTQVHLKPELDVATPTAPESSEESLGSFDGCAIMEIRDSDQFAAAFQDEYYLDVIAPDEKAFFDTKTGVTRARGEAKKIF